MTTYYNEIDPHAAQWLRNLISAGLIAPGDVDERSIEDVRPDDLRGYAQCHFFAGIGGWAYALDLAGWPRDRPVWTGSCPCQPFSAAGKGAGFEDERHLWPAWQHLIAQCRPPVVFGEQVASKAADPWIDLVHADLEGMGYAFGCIPFPSAGVGAPHIRDRNYWLADAHQQRRAGFDALLLREESGRVEAHCAKAPRGGEPGGVADAGCELLQHQQRPSGNAGQARPPQGKTQQLKRRGVGDCDREPAHGLVGRAGAGAGATNGFWRDADWLRCRDGKWRPVEPGTQPLADGIPARVVRLRAYGNAINPWQAAEFVAAYMEATGEVQSAQEAA